MDTCHDQVNIPTSSQFIELCQFCELSIDSNVAGTSSVNFHYNQVDSRNAHNFETNGLPQFHSNIPAQYSCGMPMQRCSADGIMM